ncbi:MAG: hypothetical protein ACYDCH_15980, partial [Gaiellaceae bacterium]
MTIRRGYGDETWRLALGRDVAGLRRAAALLLTERGGFEYEGHRAAAFGLALERRTGEALEELNAGWSEEWPTPEGYGLDVARIHFLAANFGAALTTLELDSRSVERAQLEDVVTLVIGIVYGDPRLWRRGLGLALRSCPLNERP